MRVFICNIVPKGLLVEFQGSQAANNFCFNLIEGKCFQSVYSIVPKFCNKNISYSSNDGVSYLVNKGKNEFQKLLSYIRNSLLLVQKVKLSDNIWFYNLSKYSVLSYFFLRYIYRKKVFIILADYTPGRSFFSFQTILKYLLCHSCGLVTLSSRTNIQNNNTISIAGIISTKKLINEIRPIHKRIRFLFSGSLNTITGFEMVLRVFSRLPQCELYITGNGKFPQTYSNFTNLHFLGMLDYDEYKKVLVNSDVCLSFRNPHLVENCNNFPSKILEYFCFGKIVISTIKYPELADAKYIILPFNEDDMVECIDKIVSDLSNNRIAPSNYDNRDFLQDNFSISAWEKGFEKIEKNCIS